MLLTSLRQQPIPLLISVASPENPGALQRELLPFPGNLVVRASRTAPEALFLPGGCARSSFLREGLRCWGVKTVRTFNMPSKLNSARRSETTVSWRCWLRILVSEAVPTSISMSVVLCCWSWRWCSKKLGLILGANIPQLPLLLGGELQFFDQRAKLEALRTSGTDKGDPTAKQCCREN